MIIIQYYLVFIIIISLLRKNTMTYKSFSLLLSVSLLFVTTRINAFDGALGHVPSSTGGIDEVPLSFGSSKRKNSCSSTENNPNDINVLIATALLCQGLNSSGTMCCTNNKTKIRFATPCFPVEKRFDIKRFNKGVPFRGSNSQSRQIYGRPNRSHTSGKK